ncbi:MAG TPA: PQQ-dependent sugar dehydrogenase [Longimicrobiales bacterium]|nr:PQQ-dependent sugar dehydrogenase [Longimicrobiales bacterium]
MPRWTNTIPVVLILGSLACTQTTDAEENSDHEPGAANLSARLIASGLESPVHVAAPPGDARLFIVEQIGRIRVVRDGQLLEQPFLDITDRVGAGGERGLLSVAFHPRYSDNGWFYVDYTGLQGHTNVERYTVTSDADVADPASAHRILFVEQPFANHNGGLVAFGPDGMLYIGMGDGGSGGDPLENGQSMSTLLGKLVRLDVDGGDPYAVPADNPFADAAEPRSLIWSYGLRNPWRFSWDVESDRIFVADVGQNRWEEVNAERAGVGGINYGWNVMEASHCFEPESGCDRSGKVLPVHEYDHDEGCSVTGGHVYRGNAVLAIRGHYFYADWCGGWIRSFRLASDGTATDHLTWDVGDVGRVTSFGLDAAGELYVTGGGGAVYRLEGESEE